MIEYVEGDLIASQERVIVHGCNAKGKFGKGFALGVRKSHPQAYDAYMASHHRGELILGSIIWADLGDRVIGNAITQPTYGNDGRQHLSMEALAAVMRSLNRAAVEGLPFGTCRHGFSHVAMPLIGSRLGGGNWNAIAELIDGTLTDVKARVYVLPGNTPSASELNLTKR